MLRFFSFFSPFPHFLLSFCAGILDLFQSFITFLFYRAFARILSLWVSRYHLGVFPIYIYFFTNLSDYSTTCTFPEYSEMWTLGQALFSRWSHLSWFRTGVRISGYFRNGQVARGSLYSLFLFYIFLIFICFHLPLPPLLFLPKHNRDNQKPVRSLTFL